MWSAPPHQGELVSVLRVSLHCNPCASPVQRNIVMETMRYLTRHKLQGQYAAEIKLCLPHFDKAMVEVPYCTSALSSVDWPWYSCY